MIQVRDGRVNWRPFRWKMESLREVALAISQADRVVFLTDDREIRGGWKLARLAQQDVPARIAAKVGVVGGWGPILNVNPVIVGIDWQAGGGHWVLIDTVRSRGGITFATVCDPWDANVHVTPLKSATFAYTGKEENSFDLWGSHFTYSTPSVGDAFLGDILWRS
jgi:hypothetical protein